MQYENYSLEVNFDCSQTPATAGRLLFLADVAPGYNLRIDIAGPDGFSDSIEIGEGIPPTHVQDPGGAYTVPGLANGLYDYVVFLRAVPGPYLQDIGRGSIMVDCANPDPDPVCDIITAVSELENGNIEIQPTANSSFLKEFSLDGVKWQNSNIFQNPGPGLYIAYLKDTAGCVSEKEFTIVCGLAITGVATVDGTTNISFTQEPPRLVEFSLDGFAWQAQPYFYDLAPGVYKVSARNSIGCATHTITEIAQPELPGRVYLMHKNQFTEIPQPTGWGSYERVLKRDLKYYGATYEFSEMQVGFTCVHAANLIRGIVETEGPEAEILLYVYDCNRANKPFIARLNLYDFEDDKNEIKCSLEKPSLQDIIKNRFRTKVQIKETGAVSLDGAAVELARPIDAYLHSRSIVKKYEAFSDGAKAYGPIITTAGPTRDALIALSFTDVKTNELGKFFIGGTGFSFENIVYNQFEAEENGEIELEFKVDFLAEILLNGAVGDFNNDFDRVDFELYFQHHTNPVEKLYDYENGNVNGSFWELAGVVTGAKTLNVSIGEKIAIWGWLRASDVSGSYAFEYRFTLGKDSFIKMTARTETAPTPAKMYLPHELLNNAAAIISGRANLVRSEFFGRPDSIPAYGAAGCGAYVAATHGLAVRNFPLDKKPLNTSLADIIDSYQSIFGLGFGYELDANGIEQLRIEPLKYFFKEEKTDSFNIIEEYREQPAKEFIYNEIEVGYEKWGDEEINGLDEFNARQIYALPIKKNKNTLNLISKFIASGYTLELTRRKQFVTTAETDYKHDNSIFCVELNPGKASVGYEIIEIFLAGKMLKVATFEAYYYSEVGKTITITDSPNAGVYTIERMTTATGPATVFWLVETLPFPNDFTGQVLAGSFYTPRKNERFESVKNTLSPQTIYNAGITPKRNLMNWGGLVNSSLYYGNFAALIKFASGEGNTEFATKAIFGQECMAPGEIAENADLTKGTNARAAVYFKPVYINFTVRIAESRFNAIADNFYNFIEVWNGKEYKTGWVLEAKYKPEDKKATFKIIERFTEAAGVTGLLEYNELEVNELEYN